LRDALAVAEDFEFDGHGRVNLSRGEISMHRMALEIEGSPNAQIRNPNQ
jgi:hypothetical protein